MSDKPIIRVRMRCVNCEQPSGTSDVAQLVSAGWQLCAVVAGWLCRQCAWATRDLRK